MGEKEDIFLFIHLEPPDGHDTVIVTEVEGEKQAAAPRIAPRP